MISKQIIMCVDDEQVVLTSLVSQLRQAFGRRFDYETFTSADEAYDFIDEKYAEGESISLIITDWLMPKVRGDEFLVRVHKRYKDVPMIMLSGQADAKAVDRAKTEAKLFKFLSKPWQAEDLTEQAALAMRINLSRVNTGADSTQSGRPKPQAIQAPVASVLVGRPRPLSANPTLGSPQTTPAKPSRQPMRPVAFHQQPQQQPTQITASHPTPQPSRPTPMRRPGMMSRRTPSNEINPGNSSNPPMQSITPTQPTQTPLTTLKTPQTTTPKPPTLSANVKRPTPPPFMLAARKPRSNDA